MTRSQFKISCVAYGKRFMQEKLRYHTRLKLLVLYTLLAWYCEYFSNLKQNQQCKKQTISYKFIRFKDAV